MTIARELKLIKNGNDYSLISNPVKELDNYISKSVKEKKIIGNENVTLINSNKIDLTKAIVNLSLKDLKATTYSVVLSNDKGESLTFGINNTDKYLFVDRSKSGKNDFSEKFAPSISKANLNKICTDGTFKIILDKTSIEIFFNNGEKVFTEIFFNSSPFTKLDVVAKGKIEIQNFEINQLKFN